MPDRRVFWAILLLWVTAISMIVAFLAPKDDYRLVTPDHTRTQSYWQGYDAGTAPFPRLSPPMESDRMEALCLAITARMSAESRPQAMGGCIDSLERSQFNNERRFES